MDFAVVQGAGVELVGGALHVLSVVLDVQRVEPPLVGLVRDADGAVAVVLDEGVRPAAGGGRGVDGGLYLAAGRRDRDVVQLQHGVLALRRGTDLDGSPLLTSSQRPSIGSIVGQGSSIGSIHGQGPSIHPIFLTLLGRLSARRTVVTVTIEVVPGVGPAPSAVQVIL